MKNSARLLRLSAPAFFTQPLPSSFRFELSYNERQLAPIQPPICSDHAIATSRTHLLWALRSFQQRPGNNRRAGCASPQYGDFDITNTILLSNATLRADPISASRSLSPSSRWASSSRGILSPSLLTCFHDFAHVSRWSYLPQRPVLQGRMLRHELYSMIHVPRLKHAKAAELLLGFRIGTVGRRDFAVLPRKG